MAYIYRILNKITKKCYIGETKCLDVTRRWNQHKKTIENNKGCCCPALRDAVIKYGIENFVFTVLVICFVDDRFKYEIEYINKYNSIFPNGYNITNGGEGGGGFQGKKHTEEVKNKIKTTLKKKYIDNPELKKQLSERNKIVLNIPEVKERMKLGMLNSNKHQKATRTPKTDDVKRKISEGLKKYNNENKPIKIQQYDINNNLLNEYTSISEASKKTSITRRVISLYLREKTKSTKGFIWKYV
uniref:GIY-YIG domain-containing protein n=1 Tax=viral metagenome TaxID=1070528 RepID=A0A6C0I3G3_9ZZZZ